MKSFSFEGWWAVAYGCALIPLGIGLDVWRYALDGPGWAGQWGLHLILILFGVGSIWGGWVEVLRRRAVRKSP
jgi:uncharacterized membrane protein YwaF